MQLSHLARRRLLRTLRRSSALRRSKALFSLKNCTSWREGAKGGAGKFVIPGLVVS